MLQNSHTPNKHAYFIPFLDQKYDDIYRECRTKRIQFTDSKFPPNQDSLFRGQSIKHIIWKRPYDVTDTPKFFVKTPHRRDPGQGELSDCWFIVAVAGITLHKQIFERVIPLNQTFDRKQYAGMFHFRFWQFGTWYDIVVYDYLPFNRKTLQPWCCWNRQEPNEFWCSLLEKAYAKLNGGYRNLIGGAPIEAFTDLTAGVEQRFKLNSSIKNVNQFFNFLVDSLKHGCLMACSINPKSDGSDIEEIKANRLVVGHSYSVTAVRYLKYERQILRMIRLRNPWANEIEWSGSWRDDDTRWNQLDKNTQRKMSWDPADDGEFWMTFFDFFHEFDILEVCHLSPDTFEEELDFHLQSLPLIQSTQTEKSRRSNATTMLKDENFSMHTPLSASMMCDRPLNRKVWSCLSFEGQWIHGISAGGRCATKCRHGCHYWSNPQYEIEMCADNEYVKCALVISLMQKYNRLTPIDDPINRYDYIQARIYKINTVSSSSTNAVPSTAITRKSDGKVVGTNGYSAEDLDYVGYTGSYINRREVTSYLRVNPGKYLIIPSTYEPNKEGYFLLRVLNDSRISLTSSQFIPSISDFPQDESVREQLSLMLENVLFLGDLALFFPDVFHRFYDNDQQRTVLTSWCYSFAYETNFYDHDSLKILELMAQELRLIDRDPTFVNPYAEGKPTSKQRTSSERQENLPPSSKTTKKPKEKVKKKRGPGLSGSHSHPYLIHASEMVRKTLCGVIESPSNYDLSPDDVAVVTLCDITLYDVQRVDFPHIPQQYIICKTKIDDCDYFPIPFTLYYNAEEIDHNLCYGIRVDILGSGNQIKFSSEKFIPVLTDQHPSTNVKIMVVPTSNNNTREAY
ncbi:unnamed protein product [Didymodactylos carnosus]|uniref:Calpain catalytic domain-containing protein n=1 Tax=Didymodactylos carnosus TaxID=1234261 RepID=A0A813NKY5_9BILA|nr:unnamed protein product [Didymodactylos carnosus]CAF0763626.1 unnamed protein product [Didymodactylos carnosus]CAF3517178.1 unnamed protein product [Didymodactylos carnosus]CAF3543597.1 unnamed protein product [Didymodactylos carnosus]